MNFDFWKDLIKEHFPATLGLTGAAIVSFAIVVFLRQTEGPIELEGLGIKIKGAAGQVVRFGVGGSAIDLLLQSLDGFIDVTCGE